MKICLYGVPGVSAGKRPLKDPRLDAAHKLVEADKKTHAQIDVIGDDGLAEADAIVASTDSVTDLVLLDMETIEGRLGRDIDANESRVLKAALSKLESGQPLCAGGISDEDWAAVKTTALITRKPVVVATATELGESDVLLVRAYAAAGWISFLTVGGKENRAWPIRLGATAWDAGGVIHTDIQKGFIRAEIIGWSDFIAAGGEIQAKRAGKLRLETKQYVMRDYDLVNFRFNKTS